MMIPWILICALGFPLLLLIAYVMGAGGNYYEANGVKARIFRGLVLEAVMLGAVAYIVIFLWAIAQVIVG